MADGPTPQQIQQVQTNLANMQRLNDYVYNHGLAIFGNAYALLSEEDTPTRDLPWASIFSKPHFAA